jgi:hypothetical protein
MLVLTELELWPNLIELAHARGIKVAVVNGRLSERSFRGYQRIGWLVSKTPPAPASSPNLDRKKIAARLAAAEAEVQRLRKQLDNPDNA